MHSIVLHMNSLVQIIPYVCGSPHMHICLHFRTAAPPCAGCCEEEQQQHDKAWELECDIAHLWSVEEKIAATAPTNDVKKVKITFQIRLMKDMRRRRETKRLKRWKWKEFDWFPLISNSSSHSCFVHFPSILLRLSLLLCIGFMLLIHAIRVALCLYAICIFDLEWVFIAHCPCPIISFHSIQLAFTMSMHKIALWCLLQLILFYAVFLTVDLCLTVRFPWVT